MQRKNKRPLLNMLRYPIITDKTTKLLEENQYSFAVDYKANKIDIKQAIEDIFQVRVKQVNTCKTPTKKKRVGRFVGKKNVYKKAIITLHRGYSIPIFPNN